jgi:hypothetical protein
MEKPKGICKELDQATMTIYYHSGESHSFDHE